MKYRIVKDGHNRFKIQEKCMWFMGWQDLGERKFNHFDAYHYSYKVTTYYKTLKEAKKNLKSIIGDIRKYNTKDEIVYQAEV